MNEIRLTLARLKCGLRTVRTSFSATWIALLSWLFNLALTAGGIAAIFTVDNRLIAWTTFIAAILLSGLLRVVTGTFLFVASSDALEGLKPSIKSCISAVWKRRKHLAAWWIFSTFVSLGFAGIAQILDSLIGPFVKWLPPIAQLSLELAWSAASYFAIPVLMTHPDTPMNTLKHSANLFRKHWKEGATFSLVVPVLVYLIATLGGFVVMLINYIIVSANPDVPTWVFPMIYGVVTLPLILALLVISGLVSTIFVASLYRFAETGDFVGPFPREMIINAFKRK